jgi:zinc protease
LKTQKADQTGSGVPLYKKDTINMKKITSIFALCFLAVFTVSAQLDRSIRPEPGEAPRIELGKFESFTLDNGLQVIVVENRKVPVISFQLTLDIDPILEGEAKGYIDFAGGLMREGTTNRTKAEIDEAVDFLGANLSTFSTGMFASSLTRHTNSLLELMSDVLLNPTFPDEELQRRITQSRTGLQTIKTNGNAIAQNVAMTQVFGADHPYGEVTTEKTLDNINTDLLREYYNTYWKPNVAYIVVVGDINAQEAKTLMTKFFGSWTKGDVPTHTYPTPVAPNGTRVAFAERVGAVQSVLLISYPLVLPVGHEDVIKVSVMNSILGGGVFSGRLMQNLREDKGYTYGARSSITNDRIVGRFVASTEIRNSVTDSTVVEIFHEMNRLRNEPVDEENLQLVKNFMTGQFARSLESPRTIANFALNIKRYNLPDDYYATYLEKLNAVTVKDVQEMANKYLKPDNSIIVVAGNMEEVPETLRRFSATGEVEFFDPFGKPWVAPEVESVPAGVTLQSVLNKYYDAVGGKEAYTRIVDKTQVIEIPMMGQVAIVRQYQQAPNKLRVETAFGGMVVQTQIFDGKKASMSGMMGKQEFTEGPEFEAMKMQAIMNMEMDYAEYGIEKTLEGIARVDGKQAYKVSVVTPSGQKTSEFYDVATGLKIRTESEMGVASYEDYRPFVLTIEGEKPGFFARMFGKKASVETFEFNFPRKRTQQAGGQLIEMTITEISMNTGIEESQFKAN